VITGAGFGGFIASPRFISEFDKANLKGIDRWEQVELRPAIDKSYSLAVLASPTTRAKLDEMNPVFNGPLPDCSVCGGANLDSYERVVVDEPSWSRGDIFAFTNVGVMAATEQFAQFVAQGAFTGIDLVQAERFVPSFARKGK
jgi:hypothetical protein